MAIACERIDSPPDLLRRFVSTPHRVYWRVGTHMTILETNNPALLRAVPNVGLQGSEDSTVVKVKVIVDPEFQLVNDAAPLVMDAGSVLWGRTQEMMFVIDETSRSIQVFLKHFQPEISLEPVRKLLSELVLSPAQPWMK